MDMRTTYHRARTLAIAIPLMLLAGILVGQTSSPTLPPTPLGQATAPAANPPEVPQTGNPQTSPPSAQPEAHSTYPHKEARVLSAATVPPFVPDSAKSPDDKVQTLHVDRKSTRLNSSHL